MIATADAFISKDGEDALSPEQLQGLGDDLQSDPHDQNRWDGPLLAEHTKLCFRVELSIRQAQRLLRLLRNQQASSSYD